LPAPLGTVTTEAPMQPEKTTIDVGDLSLVSSTGQLPLSQLAGTQVLVMLRHRH
jgi:hypothetical protein